MKRSVLQTVFDNFQKENKKVIALTMLKVDNELQAQHERGIFNEGDPNHPIYNSGYNYATGKFVNLFGYEKDEFLAKQY